MELKINNDEKKSEIEKSKELLISILKQKLDMRLSKLERRNKMHLNLMNVTTQSIKEITDWSINANNQIKEKYKKNKTTTNNNTIKKELNNKPKKYEKIESRSNTRKQSFRSKTPLRNKSTKSFITDETKALTLNRNFSKSNKYFISATSKSIKTIDSKNKSNSFVMRKKKRKSTAVSHLNLEADALKRPSVLSNKSNKTSISKKSKNIETPVRKKTPFKKKNEKTERNNINIKINENKNNENVINSKIIKNEAKNDDIIKMEHALQKGEFLTNNDPLLITPITDLDFIIDKKMSNSNISLSNLDLKEKEKEKMFNSLLFNQIDDKIFTKISDFLNINDLITFKNVSKFIHKFFIIYIKNNLEKDKIFFTEKLKKLNMENSPPKELKFEDFEISEKSLKAIRLLNEPSVNKFFFEKTSVDDNRVLIYRIFFQLIKHPYSNIERDKKEEFWDKCQYYFSHETNGKVGVLLQKILDEKMINIDGNNLYKLYKLVYKDLNKIYPQYFSKLCGVTGLITFFIKDILDFIGISNDENIQINAYWTYNNIIDNLNHKINQLNNSNFH